MMKCKRKNDKIVIPFTVNYNFVVYTPGRANRINNGLSSKKTANPIHCQPYGHPAYILARLLLSQFAKC